jgi:hypothetical protein
MLNLAFCIRPQPDQNMKITFPALLAVAGFTAPLAQAVTVNLTTAGSTGGPINGALFHQIDPSSTGTGVIDSFVQIGGNDPVVNGYNTTVNGTLYNGSADNFNHSITVGLIPVVTISGTPYRQFLLDINENNNRSLDQFLSLDDIQIFLGGTANSSVDTFTAGELDHDGALIYHMDLGGDSTVGLNYALNTGSGSGDMFLYVPSSLFGTDPSAVVTLYSQFGGAGIDPAGLPLGNYNNSDGFEEWAVLRAEGTTVGTPEGGATLTMLGLAVLGLGLVRRQSRKA